MHFDPVRKVHLIRTLLLLIAAVLVLGQLGGCANPIVLPKTARLGASDYKPKEYPFKVTINAYQDMRFNVHTFEFGSEKVPVAYYLYLKRRSGVLGEGDFLAGLESTIRPQSQKGTIAIEGGRITVDLTVPSRYINGEPSGWKKSSINGTYELVAD